MNHGKYVFTQIFDFISHNDFLRFVKKYDGDYKVKHFSCWKQFLCMAFGQLTHKESLSDTILCIRANSKKLYHIGIGVAISKSTLSKANENRNWLIYQDFALLLIAQAKVLYQDDNQLEVDIKNNIFIAVKLRTKMDAKTSIPDFIHVSDGKMHDVNVLDLISILPESFYVMDRGYLDFFRIYRIAFAGAYFVIRAKKNLQFRRMYSAKVDKTIGVNCVQTIKLTGFYPSQELPEKLRRIKYYDNETDKTFVFLTNNFELEASEIAQLYTNIVGL